MNTALDNIYIKIILMRKSKAGLSLILDYYLVFINKKSSVDLNCYQYSQTE